MFAACALWWPFPPARAQEEENEELEEEFELIEQQADIVTSAAKHEQKIGFSPSAVVVITRKEIEESGATTLADLLRRYPVTWVFESDPLYPAIEVRTNYRVLLLVDGREVNHEWFVAPFYATLPVGLPEIERIEMVLGPNSAIYGANAVSAVINVITRRSGDGPGAEATLAAGEHGGLELDLRASEGTKPLALKLSGGLSRSDFWMQKGKSAKDVWRADGRTELDRGSLQLALDGGFSRVQGSIFGVLGNIRVPTVWMIHADASFKYRGLSFHSFWYGLRGSFELDAGLYYPLLGRDLGTIPRLHLTGDTVHNEAMFELQPFSGNLLILGADTRYTRYWSPQFVPDDHGRRDRQEVRAGAYFHDEQKLGERWMLQAGLRFDWNSRTDWALSPRGAVIFNPGGDQFFRLSGGLAFRKPSMMETAMNFDIVPDPAFPEIEVLFERYGLSNPDLENELLGSIELGWRNTWLDGRLKASLDAYAAFNRHVIGFRTDVVFDQTPLGPQLNLEKSEIGYVDLDDDTDVFGAHVNLEGKPLEWLSLFLRADLRISFFAERGYAKDSNYPSYIVAAGGTFQGSGGLHGQAVLVAAGETMDNLRNPESILMPTKRIDTPPLQYLMLFVGRTFEFETMKIDAGLNFFNVFNNRYREEAGTIDRKGTNFGGEMLGRRLMALLRVVY